ncbi:hypothetical protein ACA910_009179 [Epithemia clementina (nom. ined.)]
MSISDKVLNDELLAGIYDLPHLAASCHQDTVHCQSYLKLFLEVFSPLLDEGLAMGKNPTLDWCSNSDLEAIRKLRTLLENGQDDLLQWLAFYPEYGSVVLALSSSEMVETMAVFVLGLDNYEFYMHHNGKQGPGCYDHLAVAKSYKKLQVGRILKSELDDFVRKFQANLAQARQRRGNKRSSSNREQGHQKTPAFILALVKQAMKKGKAVELAKGGFTDNGLHTGGKRRNTSFPLVRSIVDFRLSHADTQKGSTMLFGRLMTYFDIRIADEYMRQCESSSTDSKGLQRMKLDKTREILVVASHKFAKLDEERFQLDSLLKYAEIIKEGAENKLKSLQEAEASVFQLKHLRAILNLPGALRDPDVTIDMNPPQCPAESFQAIQARAKRNVGLVPVYNWKNGIDFEEIDSWCSSDSLSPCTRLEDCWLVVRTIEDLFWRHALCLGETSASNVIDICNVVKVYRKAVNSLLTSLDKLHTRKTEIYSREVLVTWVAYCIVFTKCKADHGNDLPNMGVCLRYQDLEHLVLADKRLLSVTHHVKCFVKNHYDENNEMFSLRCQDSTFSKGEIFARRNFGHVYRGEVEDAQRRETAYWLAVESKKQCLIILRQELDILKLEQTGIEAETDAAREAWSSSCYMGVGNRALKHELSQSERRLSEIRTKVSRKMSEIKTMNKAPEHVEQPLPKNESEAFKWLFFLHMPEQLRILATLGFTAQQMLMPKLEVFQSGRVPVYGIDGPEVLGTLAHTMPSDSIVNYHNSTKQIRTYCASNSYRGQNGQVGLQTQVPFASRKPEFPKLVDQIGQSYHGLWSPDGCHPRMSWKGGANAWDQYGGEFDPFRVSREVSVLFFTEQLESSQHFPLQWTMKQDGRRDNMRGNLPLATQGARPDWLSTTEYLHFCRVRSFPLRQMRDVLTCLGDKKVPIHYEQVQKLMFQAMFHVGAIGEGTNEGESFTWKKDLYDNSISGLVPCAEAVLKSVANVLCETPSNFRSTYLIAALSNFLCGFKEDLKNISRDLGKALCHWSSDIEKRIQRSSKIENISTLKRKQSILQRRAVVCFAGGILNYDDVEKIVELTISSKNLCLKGSENDSEYGQLVSQCLELVTSRISDILEFIQERPEILTMAVSKVINSCPDNLEWKVLTETNSFGTTGACYEARNSGCLYTVNLITGVFLVDGFPPTSLPVEVLDHHLYRRVFGSHNFEVVCKKGVFETTRLFADCLYRFFLNGSNLHVAELDRSAQEEFELLDSTGTDDWDAELKTRLKVMHSHWLCRSKNAIFLRGILFHERETSFVIRLHPSHSSKKGEIGSSVHPVPKHLQMSSTAKIFNQLKECGRLLIPSKGDKQGDASFSILTKFENSEFVHIIQHADGIFHVELPRFGISFAYINDRFICNELSDFSMVENQLLCGTMHGFSRYFVLEKRDESGLPKSDGQPTEDKCDGTNSKYDAKELLVIIPDGQVIRRSDGSVEIMDRSSSCNADCQWYYYSVHPRFRTLKARNNASRLHLAGIHLATSTHTPDSMFGLTGAEQAMQLVRESWSTKPYSDVERSFLNDAMSLSRGRFPTAFLLCLYNLQCSEQTSFLYTKTDAEKYVSDIFSEAADTDDFTARPCKTNARSKLTSHEMLTLVGFAEPEDPLFKEFEQCTTFARAPSLESVTALESSFKKCFFALKSDVKETLSPMAYMTAGCSLGSSVLQDLHASWKSFNNCSSLGFALRKHWCLILSVISDKVKAETVCLSNFLVQSLEKASKKRWRSRIAFYRLANVLPSIATPMDLLKGVYDPLWFAKFNPFMSEEARSALRDVAVAWTRLLVLDDKIQRLRKFHSQNNTKDVVKELTSTRLWNPSEYPCWVAFEAEHGIQIRPEQGEVAIHLIRNPCHVVQLNMGMGKTRVIIPMLILHWAFQSRGDGNQITRLNILPSLFSEACDFFRLTLTSSIANLRIFQLPFCRDNALDVPRLTLIARLLDQCRVCNGVFIVSPEHRLSLELKVHELFRTDRGLLSGELNRIGDGRNWRDILDESDELLHHRYRLIYATGNVEKLPEGPERYGAAQILLGRLCNCGTVQQFVKRNSSIFIFDKNDCDATKMSGIRVNSKLVTENFTTLFHETLMQSIMENPPYYLDWLAEHPARKSINSFVTNIKSSTSMIEALGLSNGRFQALLALRGFLSGGILLSCLQKRHRVDYGIARPGMKRIAIPFRGADTPAIRSEFAHPDMAIVLTCRSYYDDGLNDDQLRRAFSELLLLGEESRRKQYAEWFGLSQPAMIRQDFDFRSIDSIDKIDLSNEKQLDFLKLFFDRNMETVNFWLNTCVFPEEMQHFPQRMTATAWNLAENPEGGWLVGFSGTNDNHRQLPLQVKQYFAKSNHHYDSPEAERIWESLMGTNGLMIDCILNSTLEFVQLGNGNPVAEIVDLVRAKSGRVHALIDCGALLAGASRADIARKLLDAISRQNDLRGVTFFDKAEWKILDQMGRALHKDQSPVVERDSFSFYDEPRCRGSDLKLRSDCVAILTLGPRLCKDKFMQAAGRLRMLGRGQKLIVATTEEVLLQIRGTLQGKTKRNIEVIDVLEWTVRNTIDSNAEAIVQWASQGFFHATSYGDPNLVVEDELTTLDQLYGGSFNGIETYQAILKTRNHYLLRAKQAKTVLTESSTKMLSLITEQSREFGSHVVQRVRNTDEECERELELVSEQEQEEQIEIQNLDPRAECEWVLDSLFVARSPEDLPSTAGVQKLSVFVHHHLNPPSISQLGWLDSIYGTKNFFFSVLSQQALNMYLRLVDGAIFFPGSKTVLLLSEREFDMILEKMHKFPYAPNAKGFGIGFTRDQVASEFHLVLFHLTMARTAVDGKIPGLTPGAITLGMLKHFHLAQWNDALPDDLLACLQLFAGETVFPTSTRRLALKTIIQGTSTTGFDDTGRAELLLCEARAMADMRGYSQCYPHSALENICKEIDREYDSRLFHEPQPVKS